MRFRATRARFGLVLSIALAAMAAGRAPAAAQASDSETLYARLGGYDFIARFVDTAFPRVASHEQLVRLFRGHSMDSQRRQRQNIVDAFCQYTGGPCIYIGRDLTTVHRGLGITDEDWTAFIGVITTVLSELEVEADEKRDFLGLLEEKLRPTVIVR